MKLKKKKWSKEYWTSNKKEQETEEWGRNFWLFESKIRGNKFVEFLKPHVECTCRCGEGIEGVVQG